MRYDALAARRLLHGPTAHDIEGRGPGAVSDESSGTIGGVRFGLAMVSVRVGVGVGGVRMVVVLVIVRGFVMVLLDGGNQILGRAGPPGTQ